MTASSTLALRRVRARRPRIEAYLAAEAYRKAAEAEDRAALSHLCRLVDALSRKADAPRPSPIARLRLWWSAKRMRARIIARICATHEAQHG